MKRYILHRLLLLIPLLLGVSLLTFVMVHLAPGDPIAVQYGLNPRGMEQATVDRLRVQLGLDEPLPVQYVRYLGSLLRGDLGISLTTRTPVRQEILARLPATLQLSVAALLIVVLGAFPLGVLSALRRGSLLDHVCLAVSLLGISTPSFWLGMVLMLFFSLQLGWLPSGGRGMASAADTLRSLVLPALTLAAGLMGLVLRMMRASLLEVMSENYMRTVRAKGLPPWSVWIGHGLRNALLPVVTTLAMQFSALLGGAVIVETIFSWPGIGRLAVNAVLRRDYPVVMGAALVLALVTVLMSLVADILYTVIDPRIGYEAGES